MLLVRSTLRISNVTAIPFRITIYEDGRLLWECSVPADSDIAIPIQYCHKMDTHMYFQPISALSSTEVSKGIPEIEVPFPDIPGLKKMPSSYSSAVSKSEVEDARAGASSSSHNTSDDIYDQDIEKFPGNTFEWRRKLKQKKDSVDTLTYSHWVDFSRDKVGSRMTSTRASAFNCNFHVLTKGAPRSHHGENSGSCLLRQITISPPVTVRNLLACDIEVKLYAKNAITERREDDSVTLIKPGESLPVMNVHATNDLYISIRLLSSNSSFRENSWSEAVTIKGCRSKNYKDTTSMVSNIISANGSNLGVQMDIVDHSGSRVINLFVPFWIVTSSSTHLLYQHDTRYTMHRAINGSDDLCADQLFDRSQFVNKSNQELTSGTGIISSEAKFVPRGIGKARGHEGIIIGPELPIRGLKDAALPLFDTQMKARLDFLSRSHSPIHDGDKSTKSAIMTSSSSSSSSSSTAFYSSSIAPVIKLKEEVSRAGPNIPYRLTHCGYTDVDRATSTLRLKTKDTPWSKSFSLGAASSPTVVELTVPQKNMKGEEGKGSVNNDGGGGSGWFFGVNGSMYQNSQLYYFGILSTIADPPFERTKIVVVVDRFVVLNSVGQSIDVRQKNNENVTTIHPREESPVYWRPGSQNLQVRLSRYGWRWSGKFSLETEGEVPLRMRNEHDNTIFFVMCHVIKQGPRICVVLRGGEGVAPYRIENHTLESFRFRQGKFRTFSNLLPYHACMYAWDEPQERQLLTLDVSRSVNNGRSTDWREVGVFAFDRLQTYDCGSHLAIRIQAQGPIRVLQIHDKRITQSPLNGMLGGSGSERKENFPVLPLTTIHRHQRQPDHTKFTIKLHSIGISIIDSTPQELIYFSMKNISLQDSVSVSSENFKLQVGRIQIDSQLWSTPYPAMFYPLKRVDQVIKDRTDLLPSNGQSINNSDGGTNRLKLPFSSASSSHFLLIEFQRDFSHRGIEFFPNIVLKVAPFDLNIEGTIITSVIHFVTDILSKIDTEPNVTDKVTASQ